MIQDSLSNGEDGHSTPSPAGRQDARSTLAEYNHFQIKQEFAHLVTRTFQYLLHQPDIVETLKVFLVQLYQPESFDSKSFKSESFITSTLEAAATLGELFRAIVKKGFWSYINYHLLSSIIKEFSGDDQELPRMLEKYEQALTGFKLTTKLEVYMTTIQPGTELIPKQDPDPALFTRLSLKFNLDVTKHSFDYIDKLWKALARQLRLPLLAVLLEKVASNCIQVTWCIPSVLASYVIKMVRQCASSLAEVWGVLTVTMEDETVFPEEVSQNIYRTPVGFNL